MEEVSMSHFHVESKRKLFIAFLVGAFTVIAVNFFWIENKTAQEVLTLKTTIANLQQALEYAENENRKNKNFTQHATQLNVQAAATSGARTQTSKQAEVVDVSDDSAIAPSAPTSGQILEALTRSSEEDGRTFNEKLTEFLSGPMDRKKLAIASMSIFDMASDPEKLSNDDLYLLYQSQEDPNLKRVIAQVYSQRGDHSLLDAYIRENQVSLKSQNPSDRQDALFRLGQTRNIRAAETATSFLLDPDSNVRINALLALRSTGNQKHLSAVHGLLNDPDPAVSALASDVISDLSNLSTSARTTLSNADIEAELPPID
jgi:HEAT repeat protein